MTTVYERCLETAAKNKAKYADDLAALVARHTSDERRQRRDWWRDVSYGGNGVIEESAISRPTEDAVLVMVFCMKTQDMVLEEIAERRAEQRRALAELRHEAATRRGVHELTLAELHRLRGMQGRWQRRRDGSMCLVVEG